MTEVNLVAKIGQIATRSKHKDRFLYVGTIEPKDLAEVFFYLIEIDTPWVDGEKIKNTILFELLENSKTTGAKSQVDSFEQVVKNINNNLAELAAKGEHEWIGKLNSIIGLLSGNEIIFSQTGNISGYLFRANKISHITEKPLEKDELLPQKTFLSLINGEVSQNDKVIIANSKLYSHISLDRLRQTLTTFKYLDAIDEIAKNLRKTKIKDVNAIVFEFNGQDGNEENQVETKPNIIILDDIPESKLLHYSKVAYRGAISGAKHAGRGAKLAVSWWQKNVQPKIVNGVKSINKKKKSVTEANRSSNEKFSGLPKINYFNRENKARNRKAKDFFANLVYWFRELLAEKNRKFLYIGLIILLLGIGFIKIQINSRDNLGVAKQAESLESLNSARNLFSQAIDDLGLNREGGKEKLIESKTLAQKATESAAIKDEATNLLDQIQSKLDEINSAVRLTRSAEANYTITGEQPIIYAVGADIYSFSKNGDISKYDTRKKSSDSLASIGQSDGKIISITYSDSANLFYLYTDAKKVVVFDLATNSIEDLGLEENSQWENASAISIFSTNIYLLDPESGQIWKHLKTGDQYSAGTKYLSTNLTVKSISLAIDGDVYVLNEDGSVLKIRRSVVDTAFSIAGTPTPENQINSPMKIFTDVDTTTIFVFDKAENRVIEYSKTGQYKRQFVADKEIEISDFAVNEKMQKIWLLSGNNIYELDM